MVWPIMGETGAILGCTHGLVNVEERLPALKCSLVTRYVKSSKRLLTVDNCSLGVASASAKETL
jgi:hypothetical protein